MLRVVPKGTRILFQGEVPHYAIIIKTGVVRAYVITSTGEERSVALFSEDEAIPISWLFGETQNTLFNYDALTTVTYSNIEKDTLLEHIMASKENVQKLVKYLGTQYTAMLLRVTGLEQMRSIEKLGFALYYLLFKYGVEITPGEYVISLRLSHAAIGSLAGNTRETTSHNLTRFKRHGIIKTEHGHYIVHKSKLEHFIGEDNFRDLNISVE